MFYQNSLGNEIHDETDRFLLLIYSNKLGKENGTVL